MWMITVPSPIRDAAARWLIDIANTIEVAQNGHIHIEEITAPYPVLGALPLMLHVDNRPGDASLEADGLIPLLP
jgi:hypothetical protein